MTGEPRELLRRMFDAAVEAAQPAHCIPRFFPAPTRGRTVAIGAGKASAAMARALEAHWPGELAGLVVTRYGYAVPCPRIEIVEAPIRCPMRPGAPRRPTPWHAPGRTASARASRWPPMTATVSSKFWATRW